MLLVNRFQGEEKLYNSLIISLWNLEREMSREKRENLYRENLYRELVFVFREKLHFLVKLLPMLCILVVCPERKCDNDHEAGECNEGPTVAEPCK